MSKASQAKQHAKLAEVLGCTPLQAKAKLSDAYWRKRREDWKYAKGPGYVAR